MKGAPVLGVPRASLSTRRSRTVVWIPGEAKGEAKERRGRDWLVEDAGLGDDEEEADGCAVEMVRHGLLGVER